MGEKNREMVKDGWMDEWKEGDGDKGKVRVEKGLDTTSIAWGAGRHDVWCWKVSCV